MFERLAWQVAELRASLDNNLCHFRPLIAGVRENTLDERKAPSRLLQQITGIVTILNVGRRLQSPILLLPAAPLMEPSPPGFRFLLYTRNATIRARNSGIREPPWR